MDYVALGHIHSQQVLLAGDVPVVYPGTLEGRRFTAGELGERHLVVVDFFEGKAPQITKHRWNKRTLQRGEIDLDRTLPADEAELIARIREQFADPNLILQLKITGSFPDVLDTDRLEKALAEDFFWLQIEDQSDVFNSQAVQEWRGEKTIRGVFVQKLEARLEAAEDEAEREQLALALKLTAIAFQSTPRSRA
jgi:DNA repair exonuclease SbcCD nuclease subunit